MSTSRADWRTLGVLAVRHLFVKRGRAVLLLFGYAVGAAVMMVLLSVGEAMLVQSRDVALVGGGEVTVLPEGIDLEGLRTGSMSGLFYGIDRARFLERQLIGGRRLGDVVAATSPVIERKLLYLRRDGELLPMVAGAEIPSASLAVGAGLNVVDGRWKDSDADRRYRTPSTEELYHELDRFHSPVADSTWAEWHYFNVAPDEREWWYITYLVGGPLTTGGGGGQLLITRHREGEPVARFESNVGATAIRFDTASADLAVGTNTVTQRNGRYRLVGRATGPTGSVRIDLEIAPQPDAYFPPVELTRDGGPSGYVVAAVRALGSGTICEGERCRAIDGAPAYHDHNWGVWRRTIWNWGQGRGDSISVLYGGVIAADSAPATGGSPYFLAIVDSRGVRQVLRFAAIDYRGSRFVSGDATVRAPESFRLIAARASDSLSLDVEIISAQASRTGIAGDRVFLQMRGAFRLSGRLLGAPVADSGLGFFETFVPAPRR